MNIRMVLDASTTLAWLFNEADAATRIKPVLDGSSPVAPDLWQLEVVNAVLVRHRRKLITDREADRLLQVVDHMPIDLVAAPAGRMAADVARVARPHQLTAYDAVYLDLALRLGLPLFTRDGNLRAAAARVGVPLVAEATP